MPTEQATEAAASVKANTASDVICLGEGAAIISVEAMARSLAYIALHMARRVATTSPIIMFRG